MISQPLTERDKVLQIQNEFPWKCVKFTFCDVFSGLPFDQWRTMISFRDRNYDVQKTSFISTPKYFHTCLLSLFVWKWGDGTWKIQWELLSQLGWLQKQCCSSDIFNYSTCFYPTDVCFTRGLWRKDLFSTYFGMAHMILTIYLLEPKKHWKFLEPEDSVLSITLILEIDYKSYTTKIFHLHINQWLKDLKALLLTMKLDLRGNVSLLYTFRSNASSKVNIWRLYIKNQREKSFDFTNNSWFEKAKK